MVTARAVVVAVTLCVVMAGACSGSVPHEGAVGSSSEPSSVTATSNSSSAPTGPVLTTVTNPPVTSAPATSVPAPSTGRAPAPTTSTVGRSLVGKVVVIDPGHNEHNGAHAGEIGQLVGVVTGTKACDTTGTATNDGYSEARFTTDVSSRVAQQLRALGATVTMTRDASTPWGPCVTERAAIGNRARADVAISIHADGGPAGGHGFHVIRPGLVAGHNDAIIAPSAAFATVLHDAYARESGLAPATYVGTNGYDTRTDLGGLNLSTVPKVFIECANMRNAGDAAAIESESGRARISAAISDAIASYLGATG